MNCKEIRDLLVGYVLGDFGAIRGPACLPGERRGFPRRPEPEAAPLHVAAEFSDRLLTAEQQTAVRQHLETCAECRGVEQALRRELTVVGSALAQRRAESPRLDAVHRAAIFAARNERPVVTRIPLRRILEWAAAAMILVMLGGLLMPAMSVRGRVESSRIAATRSVAMAKQMERELHEVEGRESDAQANWNGPYLAGKGAPQGLGGKVSDHSRPTENKETEQPVGRERLSTRNLPAGGQDEKGKEGRRIVEYKKRKETDGRSFEKEKDVTKAIEKPSPPAPSQPGWTMEAWSGGTVTRDSSEKSREPAAPPPAAAPAPSMSYALATDSGEGFDYDHLARATGPQPKSYVNGTELQRGHGGKVSDHSRPTESQNGEQTVGRERLSTRNLPAARGGNEESKDLGLAANGPADLPDGGGGGGGGVGQGYGVGGFGLGDGKAKSPQTMTGLYADRTSGGRAGAVAAKGGKAKVANGYAMEKVLAGDSIALSGNGRGDTAPRIQNSTEVRTEGTVATPLSRRARNNDGFELASAVPTDTDSDGLSDEWGAADKVTLDYVASASADRYKASAPAKPPAPVPEAVVPFGNISGFTAAGEVNGKELQELATLRIMASPTSGGKVSDHSRPTETHNIEQTVGREWLSTRNLPAVVAKMRIAEDLESKTGREPASYPGEGTLSPTGGSRPNSAEEKKSSPSSEAVLKKLEKTVIPEIDFRQANIHDVVEFLNKASVEGGKVSDDQEKKGVNIVLNLGNADKKAGEGANLFGTNDQDEKSSSDVTFTARYISLLSALKIITKVGGLNYRITDGNVVIEPDDNACAQEAVAAVSPPETGENTEPAVEPVYPPQVFNPMIDTKASPFSTFGLDVDTASFTLARRYLMGGRLPPVGAIRVEEFVNAFEYAYPAPDNSAFAVYCDRARSPFRPGLEVLRIGVRGKVLGRDRQRPSVLTFIVDTSGSMNTADRLELAQKALALMVGQLSPADSVAIVAFGTEARLVLDHTPASAKDTILKAIASLQTYGSTQLEGGIRLGYEVAARNFKSAAVNRVLLLSDGVANLGAATPKEILDQVEAYRKQGIYCSVFGVGVGTYNDSMLQALADKGDGVYRFLDSLAEARRILVDELAATLHVIAKDVKIQVEFDPARVKTYRQIGYEKRHLEKEQFRDDTVDAGEVGSGQSATALYEVETTGAADEPLGVVRMRWKDPESGLVTEVAQPIRGMDRFSSFESAPPRFRLAVGLAELADWLRGNPLSAGTDSADILKALRTVGLELSLDQQVQDAVRMAVEAARLRK